MIALAECAIVANVWEFGECAFERRLGGIEPALGATFVGMWMWVLSMRATRPVGRLSVPHPRLSKKHAMDSMLTDMQADHQG